MACWEWAAWVLPGALAADADRVRRFQQEARAAGALSHPNLLSLFDLGEEDAADQETQLFSLLTLIAKS